MKEKQLLTIPVRYLTIYQLQDIKRTLQNLKAEEEEFMKQLKNKDILEQDIKTLSEAIEACDKALKGIFFK